MEPEPIDIIREECRRYLQNVFNRPFLWDGVVNCLNRDLRIGVCVTLEQDDYEEVAKLEESGYCIIMIPKCDNQLKFLKDKVNEYFGDYVKKLKKDKLGFLITQVNRAIILDEFDDEAYYQEWAKQRLEECQYNVFERIKTICEKYKLGMDEHNVQQALEGDDKLPVTFRKAIAEFYYLSDDYGDYAPYHVECYDVRGNVIYHLWTNENLQIVCRLPTKKVYYEVFESVTQAVDYLTCTGVAKLRCVENDVTYNEVEKMIQWLSECCIYASPPY